MSFVCDSNSNHHVSLDSQQRLSSTAPIIATTMLSSSGSVACDLQQCSTASHVHVSPLQKLSIDLFKTYKQINEVYYTKKRRRLRHDESITSNGQSQPATHSSKNLPTLSTTVGLDPPTHSQQSVSASVARTTDKNLPATSTLDAHTISGVPENTMPIIKASMAPLDQPPFGPGNRNHNNGFDDENDYYIITKGEIFLNRYEIHSLIGKGSFGQVVKAFDLVEQQNVAIKIIRNKATISTHGEIEISLLKMMNCFDCGGDELLQAGKEKVVRLKSNFVWRKHICLVFELLSYSLYDLLRYTMFRGVSLNLTRKFALQICGALHFMSDQLGIVHCDLKPENILLLSTKRSAIKIIDFGSSWKFGKYKYFYVQSRFYRSPEVLLGIPYGAPIDMWSLGCILVEMHTGLPLFPGVDELDLLRLIVDLLGMPPDYLIEKSPKKSNFFVKKPNGNYELIVKERTKKVTSQKSLDELLGTMTGGPNGCRMNEPGHTVEDYMHFKELILRMLVYDPNKRITPLKALSHPFIRRSTNP